MANAPLNIELAENAELIITRRFDAAPELVYRVHTEPALIQKWMLGPPGWTMRVCHMDVRQGGSFRYEFSNGAGDGFAITGEYVTLEPGLRIVHVERMLIPDPTPDNSIDTRFEIDGTGTKLVMRMSLPDAATRKAMLESGMVDGMEASFANLDALEASVFES